LADWKVVRFDPTYIEPLDKEIIPLCDILNEAGFVTTASCSNHGHGWPIVWFEHSSDKRIESLARFVMEQEAGDFRPHFTLFKKQIDPVGYTWSIEIHLNDVDGTTLQEIGLREAEKAINKVTESIKLWFKYDKESKYTKLLRSLITSAEIAGPPGIGVSKG
jgi:hypothetical protein